MTVGNRKSAPTEGESSTAFRRFLAQLPGNIRETFLKNGATPERVAEVDGEKRREDALRLPRPEKAHEATKAPAEASTIPGRAAEPAPKRKALRREDGSLPGWRGRRREVQARKLAKQRADAEYQARFRRQLKRAGIDMEEPPRAIPRDVWIASREMLADTSGRAIGIYARRERNKVAVGLARRAALRPRPDGTTVYDWSHPRARSVMALALCFLMLSVETHRKGPYCRIVRGITLGGFQALLADPNTRHQLCKGAFTGIHRPDGRTTNQCGYITALEREGFLYRQQLPASECQPFERFGGKYACNRYWIVGGPVELSCRKITREEYIAAHEEGREFAPPNRPPRGKLLLCLERRGTPYVPPAAPS